MTCPADTAGLQDASPSADLSSPKPWATSSSGAGSSPAKSEFWTVPPNPHCVSCYDEHNVATGLWAEKGGDYLPCPDCFGTCFHCTHASRLRPGKVDCAIHGMGHDATQVCERFKTT